MKPCLVISLNSSPVLQACGKPSSHLVESSGEIGETGKGSGATTDAFERQLCFLSGLSQTHYNQLQKYLRHCTVFWLNRLRVGVSPFLAWGDFHARSRFARPTIPEEKWGTTRSLWLNGLSIFFVLYLTDL